MATLRGTARSAAPVSASSVRAATCVLLGRVHVDQDLVVDLEDQVGGEPALLQARVQPDEGQL